MKIFRFLIFGLCSLLALFSCKKDDANVGAEISLNSNEVKALLTDSFEIITYSNLKDSVITSGIENPVFGSINSDEFGIAKSSLFASIIPDSLDRKFPQTDYKIDSFYIRLNIKDFYGKNIDQDFEVRKINEPINEESNYYNFDSLPVGEKIGSFTLNTSDSGIHEFNLDLSAGEYLFSDLNSNYESKQAFKNFFNGIYISPVSSPEKNTGAIYKLSKSDISIHLSFSTTNQTDDQYDNHLVYFVENENNIFSNFSHNFDGSEANVVFNDSTKGQNTFFSQGLSGAYGKIEFPTLQQWFEDDSISYLITNYEFKLYAVENTTFNLPAQLILTYNNSIGTRSFKSSTINSEENSYIFKIYNAEVNTALEMGTFNQMNFQISHPFPANSPEQVKFLGPNSDKPPRLKISYTSY